MYEGIVEPTDLYGTGNWNMGSDERRRLNAMMECLRSMLGVRRKDQVRNEEVRRKAVIVRELADRAEQGKNATREFGEVDI